MIAQHNADCKIEAIIALSVMKEGVINHPKWVMCKLTLYCILCISRYISDISQSSAKGENTWQPSFLKEQLQNGNLFQGDTYGGVPISFFWMQLPPDEGPRLHFHPYDEVFIILEGQVTFSVGDQTIEVEGGNIVIGPANVPHKFTSSGKSTLRAITIHPSPHTIGTRVEE